MKKSGKTDLHRADRRSRTAAMRKAMEPVYKDMAARVGKDVIDEFVKETQGASN